MPDMNDFHAFKSTSGGSGRGSRGGNFGCGWVVIAVAGILLLFFIAAGASGDAIDTFLGLGFIAFLITRFLFR